MRFSPQRCAIFRHRKLQKVLRDRQLCSILTWKFASRHSGVQLFDIETSKSAPRPSVFLHFDLGTRFSPQRRAIFSTSELEKSAPNLTCFVHFHFKLCFLPQGRPIFRHRNFKSAPRPSGFFILTWKCASRHSGVQFSTSELQKVLRS